MSIMTMSVFVIAASLWMKFLINVDNVSSVIPPHIMMCLPRQKQPFEQSVDLLQRKVAVISRSQIVERRKTLHVIKRYVAMS